VDVAKSAAVFTANLVPFAGPAVGAAIQTLFEVGVRANRLSIEQAELENARALLDAGKVDAGLFRECPLLGSYFLCMADNSVVLNWASEDIYDPGFQDNIEALKKKAEPVIEQARQFIRQSKHCLAGTKGFKGLEFDPKWRNNKIEYVSRLLTRASFIKFVCNWFNDPTPVENVDAFREFLLLDANWDPGGDAALPEEPDAQDGHDDGSDAQRQAASNAFFNSFPSMSGVPGGTELPGSVPIDNGNGGSEIVTTTTTTGTEGDPDPDPDPDGEPIADPAGDAPRIEGPI
jgi:hypothetical protein